LDRWRINRDTREVGVPTPKETGDKEERTEVEKAPTAGDRRIYASNYRNKHKAHINKQRRAQEQEPLGAYKKARRRAKYKKQQWDISFDNWFQVWNACPKIFDDGLGIYQYAWQMRSGDIQKGTQMRRKDTNLGWTARNAEIVYRNQPIPVHGIVALWDYKRDEPTVPEWKLSASLEGIETEDARIAKINESIFKSD